MSPAPSAPARTLPSPPLFSWLAAMAGAIASGRGKVDGADALNLLTLAALVACWAALWWAVMDVDWAGFLRGRAAWRGGAVPLAFPYAEPGSLAAQTSIELGRAVDWARRNPARWEWPALSAGAALAFSLLLSAQLGANLFALNLLAIGLCAVAPFVSRAWLSAGVMGAVRVLLPMLAGAALFAPLTPALGALALGLGMAYAARGSARFHWGYALVMAVMLFSRYTLGAFLIALFWLPHFLMALEPATPQTDRLRLIWLAATMLVCAIALT
ncbi:MAG TPA: hypothetical protein PL141_04505 [Thermoflexales bacterium]|nr:hypothetical protein [Thermoflexales bacterium]HQW34611.1 hypothetical protein [Thermoflexales bacterium]